VTILHKHGAEPANGHRPAKVALVLAGGALTGGAFKLGALQALDDVLLGRNTTELDLYVGLSAGALLAAPLAAGVTPAAMVPSLKGDTGAFTPLGVLDLYAPNLAELVAKPIAYLRDLAAYTPACARDLLRRSPRLLERVHGPVTEFVRAPSRQAAHAILAPLADAIFAAPQLPSPLDYLPSGLFDNAALERYLRLNLERNGIPNEFRALARLRDSALYVVATDVDTAERVVFGHDEDTSLTISEAVQASTALPGFYKPARLGGVDYVDGGVRRTANIDVAIEHGADLIICYNPFRPFTNRAVRDRDPLANARRTGAVALTDRGLLTVLNQVLRTLLHSRLQLGLHQYLEDPRFRGDIVLIEPMEEDVTFFEMAPLDFRQRQAAALHGYESATRSLESNHDAIAHVLERHGLGLARGGPRPVAGRIATAPANAANAAAETSVGARRAA
jgi:predicted acylesterase/phospholipase RssA